MLQLALALVLAASADAGLSRSPAAPAAAPSKREVGALVLQDIPEIPADTLARVLPYQNTRGASFSDWAPTGQGILIRTRFGDAQQVHHVEGPGMDRRQLTFFKNPVAAAARLKTHPSGFLFLMDDGGSEFHQLYWWDERSGQQALLTDGKSRNVELSVSNAGDRFLFTSNARNGTDMDLYLGTAPNASSLRRIKDLKGTWSVLDWSPDDAEVLLQDQRSVTESYLHVLNLASGTMTEVNPTQGRKTIFYRAGAFLRKDQLLYVSDEDSDFARLFTYDAKTGRKTVIPSKFSWDIEHLDVSRDGKQVAYVVNEDGRSTLYLARSTGLTQPRQIPLPLGVILKAPSFDDAGARIAVSMSLPDVSGDVFVVDVKTGKPTRWTHSEVGGLNPQHFVTPKLIRFPTFDGKQIPAWFYSPAKTPAKTPVIVVIHGGPESQERAGFSPQIQLWVSQLGASVLVPNVRGSTGYGKTYTALDNGKLREDSVKDIGALLDWVATRPDLDAQRVAVYGGSYGGFMVLSTLAHYGHKLRAGVDLVGISNFVTFLEHTQSYRRDLRRAEYGDERDPAMREWLMSISPTTNASKIRTPLFVVQGLNDPRVPASEAEQIVQAVRQNQGPVWYLLAKDEGHGFQKKTNADFLYAAVTRFFELNL